MARSAGVKFSANIVGIHLDLASQTADEPADRILRSGYLPNTSRWRVVSATYRPLWNQRIIAVMSLTIGLNRPTTAPAILINPAGSARTRIC
jgi:hypothetical protein